jgi:AcrR family transcriptional regulator
MDPVWTRLQVERPSRPPVTRTAVVDAAVALADREGLDAVSIRRVAAALDTRPMGLYAHFERKDDLIDLMLDSVIAECLVADLPDDWREALAEIARHTRATCLRHPWIVGGVERRAVMGPNAVRHLEQSLAAISGLSVDPVRARSILTALDSFTLGHLANTAAQRKARSELAPPQWRQAAVGYIDRLIASGEFPHLARAGAEHALPADDDEHIFEAGLDWLLTGISASLDQPGEVVGS